MWCLIPFTSSQELAAESLPTSSAGIALLAQSKSKVIPEKFCLHGSLTETYLDSLFGTTLPLSAPTTQTQPVTSGGCAQSETTCASVADSLAKIFQQPGTALESTARDLDFGAKWHESSVRYDRATSSWKTHQCLWQEVLPWSSVILPKWGMTRNGVVYRHRTLERPISGKGSGCEPNGQDFHHTPTCGGMDGGSNSRRALKERMRNWPTPTANCKNRAGHQGRDGGLNLQTAVAKFPTTTATQYKGWSAGHNRADPDDRLDYTIEREASQGGEGGRLAPEFVEWLMGWPKNWTALDAKVEKHCGWEQEDMSVPRVTKSCANRADRLKALGNGQVSKCVVAAWVVMV